MKSNKTKPQGGKNGKFNRNTKRISPNNFILDVHKSINYNVVGAGGQININFYP